MAVTKGKKISDTSELDKCSGLEQVPFALNGANGRVSVDTIKDYVNAESQNYVSDDDLDARMQDLRDDISHDLDRKVNKEDLTGVFIAYNKNSKPDLMMVTPRKWPALQNAGQIAAGVVVVEGGKVLVVAPTEADSPGLTWSSAAVSGGGTATGDNVPAINDWSGKANTASIISKNTDNVVTNTAAYAPGFCNLYSRVNAFGIGLTAGKWWLPSVGEMMMIYANMDKINYCLSLITGATQLLEYRYWTSTENSTSYAWILDLSSGLLSSFNSKSSIKCSVRPVSEFTTF